MNKIKTTKKQIQNTFLKVFYCGYCDLDGITTKSPLLYNSGIYGWNYDVYVFGNIAVTTGYRGMFGKEIDHNFMRELKLDKEIIKNLKTITEREIAKKNIENKLMQWLENN